MQRVEYPFNHTLPAGHSDKNDSTTALLILLLSLLIATYLANCYNDTCLLGWVDFADALLQGTVSLNSQAEKHTTFMMWRFRPYFSHPHTPVWPFFKDYETHTGFYPENYKAVCPPGKCAECGKRVIPSNCFVFRVRAIKKTLRRFRGLLLIIGMQVLDDNL